MSALIAPAVLILPSSLIIPFGGIDYNVNRW